MLEIFIFIRNSQQTFFFFFFFFSNCSYSVITVQNIRLYLPSRDDWNKETIRYKPSPHQYDFKYSCPSLCCWHHPWCSDSLRVLGCDQLNKEILHRFSFHEYIAIRNILQRCSYCKSLPRTTAASLIPSTLWLSQTRQLLSWIWSPHNFAMASFSSAFWLSRQREVLRWKTPVASVSSC